LKLLIVVDMQNDFIDGALGTAEAVSIVPNVQERIETCRREGWQIVFTRDTHGTDYLETQEGRCLPVEHCLAGSKGWMVREGLSRKGDPMIDKPSFGSETLAQYVKILKPDEIELIGLCTDICVISNALIVKAALPEVPVAVRASCCAGVTPESHETALRAMQACQIDILREA